jgi:hypothetical protein
MDMRAHDRGAAIASGGQDAHGAARSGRTRARRGRWLSLGVALVTLTGPVTAASSALAGTTARGRPAATFLGATLASPRVPGRPSDPPIGVPFQTLSSEPGGAIRIDGSPVPDTDTHGDGFNYAVISRSTRSVEKSGTVSNTQDGLAKLASLEKEYAVADGYLMVVSGTAGVADDPVLIRAFTAFVKTLGGTLTVDSETTLYLRRKRFSIVGIPGGAEGSAWIDIQFNHFAPAGSPDNGNITGYLQVNSATNEYNYVSPDLVTFDTSASRTDTSNAMTVQTKAGTERYAASLPAGYTAGFQVVILDSLTLEMLADKVFPTNGPQSAADIAAKQQQFAVQLRVDSEFGSHNLPPGTPSGRNPLILVQSIGRPKGQSPGWAADPRTDAGAASVISSLGGQRTIFTNLDGKSDYSLAGGQGLGRAALEASSDVGQPGPITGMLARGHNYSFQPVTGGPSAGINTELIQMTYETPVAFPPFTAPPLQAAETYIGDTLRLCPSGTDVCHIRPLYYSSGSEDWSTDAGSLRALRYPSGTTAFTEAQYEEVQKQLVQEFVEVAQVQSYFNALRAPFGTALQSGRIDVKTLGDTLVSALQPPPEDTKVPLFLGILAKITSIGGAAPPPFNAIAAGISGALGVASLLAGRKGDSSLADNVKVRAGALTDQMYTRLIDSDDSIAGMEKLFLSDYGKLQGVWENRNKEGWKIDNSSSSLNTIILSTRQWFAEQLIPYAYKFAYLGFGSSDANGMDCNGHSLFPFASMPRNAQKRIIGYYKSDGSSEITNLYFSSYPPKTDNNNPPGNVADLLFNPSSDPRTGSLGINILGFVNSRYFDTTYDAQNDKARCGITPVK